MIDMSRRLRLVTAMGPGVTLEVAGCCSSVFAPFPAALVRLFPRVGPGVTLEVAGV